MIGFPHFANKNEFVIEVHVCNYSNVQSYA